MPETWAWDDIAIQSEMSRATRELMGLRTAYDRIEA